MPLLLSQERRQAREFKVVSKTEFVVCGAGWVRGSCVVQEVVGLQRREGLSGVDDSCVSGMRNWMLGMPFAKVDSGGGAS